MREVCRSRSAGCEWGAVVVCGNDGEPKRDGLPVEAEDDASPYRPSCNRARNESGMLMLRRVGEGLKVMEEEGE